MKHPKVFTIASSAPFAETLARGLIARAGDDPLALSAAVIYLPTRRAARSFGDAFAAAMGGAGLLPQFRALGDSEEDELLFDAAAAGLDFKPAIPPLRRKLLLAQLVRHWDRTERGGSLSFAQYAALADSLIQVMDEVETQDADLSNLSALAPADLAEHWQSVTRFLDLIREQWPAILETENALNPAARRVLGLRQLAARYASMPPQGWVIGAGSTGSIPATAELLSVIARLPNGAVVLPGLDKELDTRSWADLDPGHPQFGLAQLLRTIGCPREEVEDWCATGTNAARERLLSETLRPVPTTDAWRALAENGVGGIAAGLKGIALAECADTTEEALAIALALRQALETAGRRAALVTPDRGLARRVAAELTRWGIVIDDSAGRPLAHTAAGSFLCLLAEAADAGFAPVPLLALLKHPFASAGQNQAGFRARARELDRWCLRGPRPDAGLSGIGKAIESAQSNPRNQTLADPLARLALWWREIAAILAPLEAIYAANEVALETLCQAHVAAAEALACDDAATCLLWGNADGELAAQLCADLKQDSHDLPPIEPGSYAPLFRDLAMKVPVRAAFGRHPRLAILGPLEARLQRFDLAILGGLNEGTWPRGAGQDPWFSRPMRAALGLEQPERGIGLSAHDFAMLAAGPSVLLTRAMKVDGAPATASRWLQRLQQLTRGLKLQASLKPEPDWPRLAAQVMEVPQGPRLARPSPKPPVEARPRRLSVTEIETWLRDPYAIYAKHVLRLRPLEALDEEVGPIERGNALHTVVEEFVRRWPSILPDDALARLVAIADDVFERAKIPKSALAIWRPRFLDAAQGFLDVERGRRADMATPHVEKEGKLEFDTLGGQFALTGRADRIDVLKNGTASIIDYKSGTPPSAKQVRQMLSPQLPLEAAILAEDGFGIGMWPTETLIYLSLADGRKSRDPTVIDDGMALATEALDRLKGRVANFDREATAYYPRILPFKRDSVGDYDHLARVREWLATADET